MTNYLKTIKKALNNTNHKVHHVLQDAPEILYLRMRDRFITQLTINATEEITLRNQSYTLKSVMVWTGDAVNGHWRALIKVNNNYNLYDDWQPPETLTSTNVTSTLKHVVDFIYVANTTFPHMPITFSTTQLSTSATTTITDTVSQSTCFESPQPSTSKSFRLPQTLTQHQINNIHTLLHTGMKRKDTEMDKDSHKKKGIYSNNLCISNTDDTTYPYSDSLSPPMHTIEAILYENAEISKLHGVTSNELNGYITKSPFHMAIDKVLTDIPHSDINTDGPWYYYNIKKHLYTNTYI